MLLSLCILSTMFVCQIESWTMDFLKSVGVNVARVHDRSEWTGQEVVFTYTHVRGPFRCASLCMLSDHCLQFQLNHLLCTGYGDRGTALREATRDTSTMYGHFTSDNRNTTIGKRPTRKRKIQRNGKRRIRKKKTKRKGSAIDEKIKAGTYWAQRYDNGTGWKEALLFCKSQNASLMKLDTTDKWEYFSYEFFSKNIPSHKEVWFGLYRIGLGEFTWVDGTKFANNIPLVWNFNQPNNDTDRGCVSAKKYPFTGVKWNCNSCAKLYRFVCEQDWR